MNRKALLRIKDVEMEKDTERIFNRLIEQEVGMKIEEIRSRPYESVTRHIEKNSEKKLKIGNPNNATTYRGKMLLQ